MSEDDNSIKFYSAKNNYGEFSNFYPSPIVIDDVIWPTTEHYFQAQKFVSDPAIVTRIRVLPTPNEAAKEGRRRDLPLRSDWESVKEIVMMEALRAKFTQHPELGRVLLSTGDKKIIEHTSNDRYWADGGGLDHGQNRLGVLLMRLRNELREKESENSGNDDDVCDKNNETKM
ncbi:13294_t:CDS:2 [Ambispora leptoticha]|uniref:13294_t:CDS:1 n=1 Tax=Ambispora leptoticha TaxID=144679 RepID=A0A9N9AYI0_9GLOM|nr:13294_t:CDS:2 [Ambispora leptoticha]